MNLITTIEPKKKFNFKELVQYILTEYYDHNDVTLYISYNDKVCDHFSVGDTRIDALLEKSKIEHTYNLVLREGADMKIIIPHEMVHLHQYEIGDLEVRKDENNKTIFVYKNKEYPSSTPYEDRPWEKEAHELDNKLYKLFKKHV